MLDNQKKREDVFYDLSENVNTHDLIKYMETYNEIRSYTIVKKGDKSNWRTKGELRYKVWNKESIENADDSFESDSCISLGHRDIFYSPEFDCLIIDVKSDDDNREMIDLIKEYFEKI